MKKTIVVYGSSTGNCEGIANKIATKLGCEAVDVNSMNEDTVKGNDNLILGTSTWGAGDMQDDWYDGVKVLKNAGMQGKTVAIFGCGDCESYSDTFCGGMAELCEAAKQAGANVIGEVAADGYNFDDSAAVENGMFVGLALDEDNESDKTDERIGNWIETIKPQL